LRRFGRYLGGSTAVSWRSRSARRPRLLFLSCHLPSPPISGGRRRELELIRRVAPDFDVHLVVISKTLKLDLAHAGDLRRYCGRVEVFSAEGSQPSDEPAQVTRHRCPPATGRIGEILAHEQADLIHVEGFYLMQHVPEWANVPVLLVEQNVEYELQRQQTLTATHASVLEGFAACARTRAAECESWRRATLLAAVTEEDRQTMLHARPRADVRVIPDGADHLPNLRAVSGDREFTRPPAPLVTLLANFAYAPNVDAARHLCHDVLPSLRERAPDVHVWLVGNEPPATVRELQSCRVRVTGRVPDVVPYLDAADVVVCPLRIGGGIKVKAIEALRRGKAIVTTPIGAQGLPAAARAAVRIASDPAEFAEATATLLLDATARSEFERRAHQAATVLPSWDDAARELIAVYDELLARENAADPARDHATDPALIGDSA
jgi:polysaccharide biosynthesis protein PslH